MTRRRCSWDRLFIATLLGVVTNAAQAQADSATRHGPAVTWRDAAVLGVAGVGSAVLFGADQSVANQLRGSSLHKNALANGVMDGARVYSDPGVMLLSAGLWVAGEFGHNRTQRLIGLRPAEALIASGVLTGAIKLVAGRARPYQSPTNAHDFRLFRGATDGGAFESFPSGHTTAAFAFAAAVDAEWGRLVPSRPKWVAPVLYGAAGLAGFSRMYQDKHWASDVLMGAAIGYVAAHAVVRWHADRP